MITIENLAQKLTASLPGEKAHIPLLPPKRPLSSLAFEKAENYRESAVAMVIYPQYGKLNIVLIERNIYKGIHSGQISFPGGKKEVDDFDLQATAIRETYEEIGVAIVKNNLMGKLTPVFIPVSNFSIQPFVYFYDAQPQFLPDAREVSEILTFPVELLQQDDVLKSTSILLSTGKIMEDVPYFAIQNKVVWGATAMILNEFIQIIKS